MSRPWLPQHAAAAAQPSAALQLLNRMQLAVPEQPLSLLQGFKYTKNAVAASCYAAVMNPRFQCLLLLLCRLLAGESGVQAIDRFDASEFPTRFAAQIKNFDDEG
jgi:hypothetical protein